MYVSQFKLFIFSLIIFWFSGLIHAFDNQQPAPSTLTENSTVHLEIQSLSKMARPGSKKFLTNSYFYIDFNLEVTYLSAKNTLETVYIPFQRSDLGTKNFDQLGNIVSIDMEMPRIKQAIEKKLGSLNYVKKVNLNFKLRQDWWFDSTLVERSFPIFEKAKELNKDYEFDQFHYGISPFTGLQFAGKISLRKKELQNTIENIGSINTQPNPSCTY